MRWIAAIFFGCISTSVLSWNALGHQLTVQLALQYMQQIPKSQSPSLPIVIQGLHSDKQLIQLSTWFDTLHRQRVYSEMHYVSLAFSEDGTPLIPKQTNNAIVAVKQAQFMLADPSLGLIDRVIALAIVLHVTADLHQPLHAATRVSREFPQGDLGGNRLPLVISGRKKNLHAYWDSGAGWLNDTTKKHTKFLKENASSLQARWPCDWQRVDLNPEHWASESHALARQYIYQIKPYTKPTANYEHMAQALSQERIAMAACRLSVMLSQTTNTSANDGDCILNGFVYRDVTQSVR